MLHSSRAGLGQPRLPSSGQVSPTPVALLSSLFPPYSGHPFDPGPAVTDPSFRGRLRGGVGAPEHGRGGWAQNRFQGTSLPGRLLPLPPAVPWYPGVLSGCWRRASDAGEGGGPNPQGSPRPFGFSQAEVKPELRLGAGLALAPTGLACASTPVFLLPLFSLPPGQLLKE